MYGALSILVGEGDEHHEQHKRRGNKPVGVSCSIDVLEVNVAWLIDFINELGVKVSCNDGDARFKVHDMSHGGTRGTECFDEGNGSRGNQEDIGQVKGQTDQTG